MSLYDFEAQSIDKQPVALSRYKCQVMLIVNTASACGLTPQFAGLEALWQDLRGRGLVVLGFPCNQFANQEPGTDAEILEFATSRFDVNFPMFSKIEVNGDGAAPLYRLLKDAQPGDGETSDITWNFEKFLVDREGTVVARFNPMVTPEQIAPELEAYLGGSAE